MNYAKFSYLLVYHEKEILVNAHNIQNAFYDLIYQPTTTARYSNSMFLDIQHNIVKYIRVLCQYQGINMVINGYHSNIVLPSDTIMIV